MKEIFCTVFTPTYNRVDTLERLYESLINQEFKNFEWLIVDDGSIDNTKEYISRIKKEKKLRITYIYQENGGKHVAINNGIDHAKGKVFAIVDSDDYLVSNAISKIKEWFDMIEKENNGKRYAGVSGRKGYSEIQGVGTTFDGEFIDAKNTERRKFKITGDKFEIFYTEVLKNNKFPVYKNEKFMTEMVLWNRLARQELYLRYYQDIIYICEYLEGGLTNNIKKYIANSPKGYALKIREQVKYDKISFIQKIKEYSLYFDVRKDVVNIHKISQEIEASKLMILFSYGIRKLYFLIKRNK